MKMQPISIRTQHISHVIQGSQASGNITSSHAYVADKETDHETNQILNTELETVKKYAKSKSMQKNT